MIVYIVQQLETNDYCGIGSGNEIVGATRHKETAEEMKQERARKRGVQRFICYYNRNRPYLEPL